MKKSVRLMVAVFAALVATTMAFSGCSKKETSAWKTDYEAAKKTATKQKKNIFLLFSGDDWDGQSAKFKENIANTQDFISTMGKDYVLVNLDFSQKEYEATNIDEAKATKEEKKNAEKVKKVYEEKERISQLYNVQSYPAVYITTPQGYVIATIPYDDTITTTNDYAAKVTEQSEAVKKFTDLANAVASSKKIEKVNAIDALYEETDPAYRNLLENLMREVLTLDKENTTGLLGKYEMQIAYIDAVAKARDQDVEGAAKVFTDACDKGHFDNSQKQEAYYTAAYVLAASNNENYDEMIDLLNKAFNADPKNEHADEITQTINAVKQMQAAKAAQAKTEGPATNPADSGTLSTGDSATTKK